ncbi:MAG: hypothetical protein IKN02_02795 [Prevotella sp.]|nr:hypothetical protein [Prevotella sp.]
MAYSNGRLYCEMVNGKLIGVSIFDVQRCLGVSSPDLTTLCKQGHVNPWARYKPIPAIYTNRNNKPGALTPAERAAENYGVEELMDNYTADNDQFLEDYVNAAGFQNGYDIKMRAWNANQWHRLSDFTKTDENGDPVLGVGYDHNAQPDQVQVIKNNKTYQLQPLIPAGERTLIIPPGSTDARFPFPIDAIWMGWYYDKRYGDGSPGVTLQAHEEWLSPLDLINGDAYSSLVQSGKLRRGLAIFQYNSQTNVQKWKIVYKAWDRGPLNVENRPFATYPLAWIDLTDSSAEQNKAYGTASLRTLLGEYIFLEMWMDTYESGATSQWPIPGLAYKVNISRPEVVNIVGVAEFLYIRIEDYGYYRLYFRLYDRSDALAALQQYYDSLSATIGSTTDNLFNNASFTLVSTDGNWATFKVTIAHTDYVTATSATLTARKKNASNTVTQTVNVVT